MTKARLSDPRFLRSAERLQAAIWRMAAHRPADRIAVAELCREAGITRDTFYRHAPSPIDLLSTLVTAHVRDVADRLQPRTAPQASLAKSGMTELLEHVAKEAGVYRHGLDPGLGAPLAPVLQSVFAAILHDGIGLDPDLLPSTLRSDALGRDVAVAYAAAGAVGALWVWLSDGELDPHRGAALIIAASPHFWIGDPDQVRSLPSGLPPLGGPVQI